MLYRDFPDRHALSQSISRWHSLDLGFLTPGRDLSPVYWWFIYQRSLEPSSAAEAELTSHQTESPATLVQSPPPKIATVPGRRVGTSIFGPEDRSEDRPSLDRHPTPLSSIFGIEDAISVPHRRSSAPKMEARLPCVQTSGRNITRVHFGGATPSSLPSV